MLVHQTLARMVVNVNLMLLGELMSVHALMDFLEQTVRKVCDYYCHYYNVYSLEKCVHLSYN